jgi:uncharacterized SAM-binding protein YcdF (DUF218 family)
MSYLQPLILLFLAMCAAGWVRLRRCKGKAPLTVGIIGLFLISWPPAEWLFSRPLELINSARPPQTSEPPQAIAVLAGGISPPEYERVYPLADRDTLDRCAMAAWVYRKMGPLPVLGCEGAQAKPNPVSVMRELLRGGGVPDDLISIENQSRNTHENAVYGSRILRQRGITRIVLVTDAQSMSRAAACFRKQGMTVIPAACDYGHMDFLLPDFIPNWKAIRRNERTLHELVGLGWYSLKGWM